MSVDSRGTYDLAVELLTATMPLAKDEKGRQAIEKFFHWLCGLVELEETIERLEAERVQLYEQRSRMAGVVVAKMKAAGLWDRIGQLSSRVKSDT